MTTDERQKLLRLAQAASPSPWTVHSEWTGKHSGADVVRAANKQAVCVCDEHDGGYGGGQRNVDFIAAASPSVVLSLLGRIEALEGEKARLAKLLAELADLARSRFGNADHWSESEREDFERINTIEQDAALRAAGGSHE